jgi:predicted phosphohydrolase
MKVFAIGDMHLAGGTGKTMDRFGDHWRNHDVRLFDAWERTVDVNDIVLVAGDTSWAMRMDEARPDLERIGRMKGRKVLIKGNHDYWWQSLTKMKQVLDPSIHILHATSVIIDRIAIAGTRGWLCPNDSFFQDHDHKIYNREVERLKHALESLKGRDAEYDSLIVALHYPPTNAEHEPTGFTELIDEHHADVCVYGHLHGEYISRALTGRRANTTYYLVSADAADFRPALLDLETIRRTA